MVLFRLHNNPILSGGHFFLFAMFLLHSPGSSFGSDSLGFSNLPLVQLLPPQDERGMSLVSLREGQAAAVHSPGRPVPSSRGFSAPPYTPENPAPVLLGFRCVPQFSSICNMPDTVHNSLSETPGTRWVSNLRHFQILERFYGSFTGSGTTPHCQTHCYFCNKRYEYSHRVG